MSNNKDNKRSILWGSLLLAQIVFFGSIWLSFIRSGALFGTDFVSFYTAGRLFRSGQQSELYNLDAQQAVQARIEGLYQFEGGSIFSQHPPYLVPVLALVSSQDFLQSFILWTLIRLPVLGIIIFLIFKNLQIWGVDPSAAAWFALNCALFFPVFLSLLSGQDTVFILVGLLIWFFGVQQGNYFHAGLGLAWSTLTPVVAGPLALVTFAARRKAGFWFLIGCLLLGLYSLLLVGVQGLLDLVNLLLLSSTSTEYGLNPHWMFNFLGLSLRLFPSLPLSISRQLAWGIFIVATFGICISWRRFGNDIQREYLGLAVLIFLFLSPHLHVHSLSFLLIPLLALASKWYWRGNWRRSLSIYLIPGSSLCMLSASIIGRGLNYIFVYVWIAFLLISLLESLNVTAQAADAADAKRQGG